MKINKDRALDSEAYLLFYVKQGSAPWFSTLLKRNKNVSKGSDEDSDNDEQENECSSESSSSCGKCYPYLFIMKQKQETSSHKVPNITTQH
jgi:hypothetical protein